MALRTGIVSLTVIVKSMCRLLATFRPAIEATLTAAVSGGLITTVDKDAVDAFLDGASAACTVLRVVSGY